MPRAPRLQLSAAFRDAIKNHPRGIVRLAGDIGYTSYPHFSKLLNAPRFRGTPLTQSRLRQLADIITFTGMLWHE